MAEAIRSFVWHWFGAIVIGMIFIAGTFWILPLLPWWVYVILFLIAAEIGGIRLPRPAALPRAVPLPVAALAIALLAEVLAQWTP